MLANVLTSAASWDSEHQLLTYIVPTELEDTIRIGQLVAVPYGERLVEGLIWELATSQELTEISRDLSPSVGAPANYQYFAPAAPTTPALRPIHTILDLEPALLAHQIALAQWISEYYVTPLSQVALMMLPPGLMQRSRMVLRLTEMESQAVEAAIEGTSLQMRALIGLLLAEGEVNVERIKTMLGPKRAKEILKEIKASELITRDAQLDTPRAKARVKRVIRLEAQSEMLEEWRKRTEAILLYHSQTAEPISMVPDSMQHRPPTIGGKKRRGGALNPWALPGVSGSAATLTLTEQNKDSLRAQHQLAAVDLLQQNKHTSAHWTPNALCKASGLTTAQLQELVRAQILSIEVLEVRRDPLAERTLVPSMPLQLTADQQQALDSIIGQITNRAPSCSMA